ncbi:MAG: hypothetical protein RLZ08_944, partial [Pseudomonadota bacterium]
GIFFKFNQNLPVYYYTGKANPKNSLKVSFCSADSKQTCVRIDNSENVRALLNNITFKSPDGKPLDNVDLTAGKSLDLIHLQINLIHLLLNPLSAILKSHIKNKSYGGKLPLTPKYK